jgi:peroxiredoxin
MARVGIVLIVAALIAGMAGCIRESYGLVITSSEGGSVTTPGEGAFSYYRGRVVNLVAEADAGYYLADWTGDVSTIGNADSPVTTITMQGNYAIIASFEQVPAGHSVLTILSTTGGSVIEPGEGNLVYEDGSVADLVATPDVGYHFADWAGDVDTIADTNAAATTITMNSSYSIIADFAEGDVALDFTLPTLTAANVTLSALGGTPVVIIFWSSVCPCSAGVIPYFESVAERSEGRIIVVAISIGQSASTVEDYFGEDEPTMTVALDEDRQIFAMYCQSYDNPGEQYPFTLFVDDESIIQYERIGAFASEAEVWTILEGLFGIEPE